MSQKAVLHPVRLLVCATCQTKSDRQLVCDALRVALSNEGIGDLVAVEFGGCMQACSEPVAIGLQGTRRGTYLFAGLDPVRDADDVARTCRAYLASNKGWIVDARACGGLRHKLRARLPAWTDTQSS